MEDMDCWQLFLLKNKSISTNICILLMMICRLVMYVERDARKQITMTTDSGASDTDYLNKCLDLLILALVDVLPLLLSMNNLAHSLSLFSNLKPISLLFINIVNQPSNKGLKLQSYI